MALFHKPPYLADLGAMVIAGLGKYFIKFFFILKF